MINDKTSETIRSKINNGRATQHYTTAYRDVDHSGDSVIQAA